MRKIIGRIFAVIGFSVLCLVAGGAALWVFVAPEMKPVPRITVLELDLERGVVEQREREPLLAYVRAAEPTLLDTLETLRRAGDDDRVKGLIASVGSAGGMGFGRVQEIRDAVRAFRETGKFAIAYADSFREFGPGTKAYYLATAFDEIWLQPSGNVGLTGLISEQPFLAKALREFEIQPQLTRRHEFKTAMNILTEAGFTEAHRASTQNLIDSLLRQVVAGIAEGRGLDPQAVRSLIDNGPYLGAEALDAGLIDGLAYRDQVYERARDKAGETETDSATVLELAQYRVRLDPPDTQRAIALIYGVGQVRRGQGYPILNRRTMAAGTLAKAIHDAVEDDDIAAIVLRIDSGGGSYVASDTIRREVARAAEAEKPVIVSMGDTAASGGYFVALPAAVIVAQPGTVTGSIGVLAGKVATEALWRRWGVNWDSVQAGANSAMWSLVRPYDDRGRQRLETFVDHIYADFSDKVAKARGLSAEKLEQVARGRVWTGADAKAHGLVDRLGGLSLAIELAKQAGGIPAEAEVEFRLFPEPKGLLDRLLAGYRGGPNSAETAAWSRLVAVVDRLGPWLEPLLAATDRRSEPWLRMPDLEPR